MTNEKRTALDVVLDMQDAIERVHGARRRISEREFCDHEGKLYHRFTGHYERKAERVREQTNAANSLNEHFVLSPNPWVGTAPITPFQQPIANLDEAIDAGNAAAVDLLIAETRAAAEQDMKRIDVLRGIANGLNEYTALLTAAGEDGDPERFIEEAKRVAQMFAVAAIEAANGAGLDLTIERRPAYPLAMGNFMLAIEIGETNKVYRARFAREAAVKELAAKERREEPADTSHYMHVYDIPVVPHDAPALSTLIAAARSPKGENIFIDEARNTALVQASLDSMLDFAGKIADIKNADPQVDHVAGLPVGVLDEMPTPPASDELPLSLQVERVTITPSNTDMVKQWTAAVPQAVELEPVPEGVAQFLMGVDFAKGEFALPTMKLSSVELRPDVPAPEGMVSAIGTMTRGDEAPVHNVPMILAADYAKNLRPEEFGLKSPLFVAPEKKPVQEVTPDQIVAGLRETHAQYAEPVAMGHPYLPYPARETMYHPV